MLEPLAKQFNSFLSSKGALDKIFGNSERHCSEQRHLVIRNKIVISIIFRWWFSSQIFHAWLHLIPIKMWIIYDSIKRISHVQACAKLENWFAGWDAVNVKIMFCWTIRNWNAHVSCRFLKSGLCHWPVYRCVFLSFKTHQCWSNFYLATCQLFFLTCKRMKLDENFVMKQYLW